MENQSPFVKRNVTYLFLAMICFSNLVSGQSTSGFNPTVQLSSNTNAVFQSQYGTSNGIDTYKYFEYKIPFHATSLTGLISFKSNSTCNNQPYPSTTARIEVNGITSSNDIHSFNSTLSEGTYFYTVRKVCPYGPPPSGLSYCCTQLIAIKVVREPNPNFDLSLSKFCKKNNHTNLFNGYMGININGNYSNAVGIFLKTTHSQSTFIDEAQLTYLSTNANLPNNTITSSFLNINSNGNYTVSLIHRYKNIYNVNFIYAIPNNSYGWTNFNFSKSVKDCMNPMEPIRGKFSLKSFPNPVKDVLFLKIAENENAQSIVIYDFTGTMRKKIKDINSSQIELNLSDLEKGIYLLEITTSTSIYKEKIVKE